VKQSSTAMQLAQQTFTLDASIFLGCRAQSAIDEIGALADSLPCYSFVCNATAP